MGKSIFPFQLYQHCTSCTHFEITIYKGGEKVESPWTFQYIATTNFLILKFDHEKQTTRGG